MSEPARKSKTRRKRTKPQLHPASPLPTMLIRLHLLRRGTNATDFGLNAIFATEETP